jgi:hypothetical protein
VTETGDEVVELSWTQPACDPCAEIRYPGRVMHRLVDPDVEVCCFCGSPTASGVFVRVNPAEFPHATRRRS